MTACDGDSTGTGGGHGGGGNPTSSTSSTSTSTSTSSTSSSGSSTSSSTSSSSGTVLINGCDPATAEDHTADAAVTITFGGTFKYTPACIKIKSGTPVTFQGDFTFHPLSGGTTGAPPTPDPASPIAHTTTGMSATFTIQPAGTYPYYCENHQPGMAGAIFAQ